MASWLQNVGSFLEKLDDRAERVVEERQEEQDDLLEHVPEDVQIGAILQARGLQEEENELNASQEENATGDADDQDWDVDDQEFEEIQQEDPEITAGNTDDKPPSSTDAATEDDDGTTPQNETSEKPADTATSEIEPGETNNEDTAADENPTSDTAVGPTENDTAWKDVEAKTTEVEPMVEPKEKKEGDTADRMKRLNSRATSSGNLDGDASATVSNSAAVREAQKEARTLRRHVVSLNKQLEHAESEMQAQRFELERAAERMEKDRIRQKEDRQKEQNRHSEEVKTLKAQQEKAMKEQKQRYDKQLEDVRRQLRDAEERRMQEGGDFNKELIDAVRREQDMSQKINMLEDEKESFLSQISILQEQQEALGSRLESLSQTAENAMEREREAENRLDEALTLHTRQLSQRQAREAELERTVSQLGTALVTERETSRTTKTSQSTTGAGVSGTKPQQADLLRMEQELESVSTQLNFEKERNQTMENELRVLRKEQNDDALAHHSRQIHTDRELAELSHTVARLEAELRIAKQASGEKEGGPNMLSSADREDLKQIRSLSEEVLKQRERLAQSNSEISALRSRLKVANDRAQRAEMAAEAADRNAWKDLEAPPISGGMRRRGGTTNDRTQQESMRAALRLDFVNSKSSEQIGKALDGMDAFLSYSGKFLRYHALARLLFILYLLLLHLWTFALVMIHAHGFEQVHGDFGAGEGISHGPHALMQQQVQTNPVDTTSEHG